jgi:putative ABC transport system ATP-binding protein
MAARADRTRPQASKGATVKLANVTKTFSASGQAVQALSGVSLTIEAGAIVAIMGPSGSGKSTLLHLLGALLVPDAGQIVVDGNDIAELGPAEVVEYRRTVGFVFQRFHLLPALTALDNVVVPVLPRRTAFDKTARARELLVSVGLEARIQSVPSRLSGGEQQRVAIARALINQPRLLLADEPTGNLDSDTAKGIVQLLARLRRELGMTTLVATHDPEVTAYCERIIRLHDGRIVL